VLGKFLNLLIFLHFSFVFYSLKALVWITVIHQNAVRLLAVVIKSVGRKFSRRGEATKKKDRKLAKNTEK